MIRGSFSMVGGLIVAGCACGPAQWATRSEMDLRCGQTVEQVAQIAQRDVRKVDVPDVRRTAPSERPMSWRAVRER
jgi:hypothetical protein